MMHPLYIFFLSIFIAYLVGLWWTHRYWSRYMNKNNIVLIPEEVQVIIPMIIFWFFLWDGIAVIMKHADREPNLKLVPEESN